MNFKNLLFLVLVSASLSALFSCDSELENVEPIHPEAQQDATSDPDIEDEGPI